MFDLTQEDLHALLKRVAEPRPPSRLPGHGGFWIGAVALFVACAAVYFVNGGQQTSLPGSPPPTPTRTDSQEPAAPALGGVPDPIVLPPLDYSDSLVREMMKSVVPDPHAADWLAGRDLIRHFTAGVAIIAEGRDPVGDGERDVSSDSSRYARYNGLAAAAAAIDPPGAARLYATLKPRIEDAYHALGYTDGPFDQTLERAIVSLLEVPPIASQSQGLTEAQKQLLRTGPRNILKIQASLRAIAIALGIPPERLPSSPA